LFVLEKTRLYKFFVLLREQFVLGADRS
jgi:hypothetical protein